MIGYVRMAGTSMRSRTTTSSTSRCHRAGVDLQLRDVQQFAHARHASSCSESYVFSTSSCRLASPVFSSCKVHGVDQLGARAGWPVRRARGAESATREIAIRRRLHLTGGRGYDGGRRANDSRSFALLLHCMFFLCTIGSSEQRRATLRCVTCGCSHVGC